MRKSFVVVLIVAAAIAGVAGAWAAIPTSPGGVFTGCVSTAAATKGALRVIDAQAGVKCKATEQTITWNQRGVNWRGTWASGTAYAVNDAVAYQGSSYLATAASSAVVPTNTAKWAVLAQKGAATAAPKLASTTSVSQGALGDGGGSKSAILQMFVPAGKQLVTWNATVVDFGPAHASDIFRCFVIATNDTTYTVTVASSATSLNSAPGQDVQTISNRAVITPPAGSNVGLVCEHDTNLPLGNYYIDPGATVSALPTS
ncbi:MAG TPA: hypothetical protein VGO03_02965 [Acidimicrobiia bacterium]|jgi:hypothetical protein